MKEIKISVFEKIGDNAAVSTEDGKTLFNMISKGLARHAKVNLDFTNIDLITSAFLNSAIGQLYSQYDSPFLQKHLKVENLAQEDFFLLKKVVERAKEYFKDKQKMDKKISEAFNDE